MNTTQSQDAGQEGRVGSTNSQAGTGDALRQGARELKQDTEVLGSKATEIAREATREGQAQVDQYRNVAAQKVDTIAESVKAAAARLQEGDAGQWSTQIAGMADSMTKFSQGLREKSADQLLHDVNRLARENPAIFVGSAVAIGFGLTRLMRATAQPRPPKETRRSRGTSDMTGGYASTGDDAYTSSTISGGAGTGLGGASSQPGRSGLAASGRSQGNGYPHLDESRQEDNDRSKSS